MLIVLESLSPAERSAFLLHDVFGYSFPEVADVVGRTPQATRQLATRARHAVEARRPRYPAAPDQQREVISAFHAAAEEGDVASLLELLDPAVAFRSDGGGVVNAARKVITGAERVARVITRMAGHYGDAFRLTRGHRQRRPGPDPRHRRLAERPRVHDRPRSDHRDRRGAQPGEAPHAQQTLTRNRIVRVTVTRLRPGLR